MNNYKNKLKAALLILIATDILFLVVIQKASVVELFNSFRYAVINLLAQKPECRDCNIVLISVDTLAADHMPCYGYGQNTAPNLCQFAKENVTVQNMFANASYTLPSHVSLFTGLYPNEHKVNLPNHDSLSPKVPLLPEVLQKNGYEVYFCMTKTDPHLPIDDVYNRGINGIYQVNNLEDWSTCIDKLKENSNKGKKTFIFLHTYAVHAPYLVYNKPESPFLTGDKSYSDIPETDTDLMSKVPQADFFRYLVSALQKDLKNNLWGTKPNQKIFSKKLEIIKKIKTKEEMLKFSLDPDNSDLLSIYTYGYYVKRLNSIDPRDTAKLQHVKNLYDSLIWNFDHYMKYLIDTFHSAKLWGNSVIIVTSDHGEEFMEHERYIGHGDSLYDAILRIPLFMHIPGVSHLKLSKPSETVDIFPTILNLVGVKGTGLNSGTDIFESKPKSSLQSDLSYPYDSRISIRKDGWKLTFKKIDDEYIPYELYNINLDPYETKNLIFKNEKEKKWLIDEFNKNARR